MRIPLHRTRNGLDIPLPEYQSASASGMDVYAAVSETVRLAPGQFRLIPAGFSIALPHGFEGQIRARSGLASKHGVTVPNAPGTVDSDYRGEVCVLLVNLGNDVFEVKRGLRIAQIVIAPVARAEWNEGETSRGARGFGHTGT